MVSPPPPPPLASSQYNTPTHCTEFRYLSVGIAFTLLRLPSTVSSIYLVKDSNNYKTVAVAVLNIIAVRIIIDSCMGYISKVVGSRHLLFRLKVYPSIIRTSKIEV